MKERNVLSGADPAKKKRGKKIFLITTGAVIGLAIIFFVSFYAAYSKIAPKQNDVKTPDNSVKQAGEQRITELEQQLQQRDEEIEVLKGLLEKYKIAVPDKIESDTTKKSSGNNSTSTSTPKASSVQSDVYKKPAKGQ